MTGKGKEWRNSTKYTHQISVKITKEQKDHLLSFPSQAEIIRYLIDRHMKETA